MSFSCAHRLKFIIWSTANTHGLGTLRKYRDICLWMLPSDNIPSSISSAVEIRADVDRSESLLARCCLSLSPLQLLILALPAPETALRLPEYCMSAFNRGVLVFLAFQNRHAETFQV